jgi:hypothetical protein
MDDIARLKKLAGISPAANVTGHMSPVGSNTGLSSVEKRQYEREHNIRPGTDEWFKLWFAKPHLTGESPTKR